jgi:hypothetical protein
MTANNTCPNCGVPISETPEEDGLHPIQMRTPTEDDGDYCEACAFRAPEYGEYENTGAAIAKAAEVDMPDEELAELLAGSMKAEELRKWMSAYDLTRPRGARKLESAQEAVAQDRVRVVDAVDHLDGLDTGGNHSAMCSCGFEQYFGDPEDAKEAASEHKSENPQHFPKAWKDGEIRIYG